MSFTLKSDKRNGNGRVKMSLDFLRVSFLIKYWLQKHIKPKRSLKTIGVVLNIHKETSFKTVRF